MMKKMSFFIILSLLGLSLIPTHLFATTRGIRVISKTGQSLYLYENYHALVVGVSNYEKWPRLPNAVNDAKEVASKLKELGFEVKLVLDPTSREVKTVLSEMVYDIGFEENRAILFYYAGHGETETLADKTKMGYIIPRDCPILEKDPKGFANHAISMRDIESASLRIKSKHVLMLFDSCFSGSLFALVRAVPHDITEKSNLPVRQYITAGREDEQVPDKSMFKRCFLIGLDGDADLTGDGYITGSELGMYLSDKVVNYTHRRQHPQYGKINNPDLDRGDFVFALKTPLRPSPLAPGAPALSLEAEKQRLAEERKRLKQLKAREQRLAEERARLERERREFEQLKAMEKRPGKPKAKEGKDWYMGPRIGLSCFTGLVGVELQIGHIALDISPKESGIYNPVSNTGIEVIPNIDYVKIDIAGGIKYYFHHCKSAGFLGVGGWKASYNGEYNDWEETRVGFMAGYRWRWRGGWDFSLGGGLGQATTHVTKGWREGEDKVEPKVLLELAFGYSF